ncbi:hypothetical protein PLICRDRAFT_46004 [Plicaturopsis crispa FD-325 SS-3]|uniref:ABM domain-containing protein n=1 Tax=Plicaturopsis crispa FD-325 SS-3 TaxID=944288 RepID=A0A0C9T8R5_PLICR|nr:hypothetical protein PLICRDRAFT_46004 [Plicaturopsis crispa FD-325 SS-3]
MTVTEILTFPTSEAYRTDQSIVKPFAEAIVGSPGLISIHHGLQIEDPAVGYLFVIWESLEAHQALRNSPAQGPLLATLKPLFAGPPISVIHAKFGADPTAALNAPVTELVVSTLKEGSSFEAISDILTKMAYTELPTILGGAYGPAVEIERTFMMVAGWESVEAHREVGKVLTPDKLELLGALRAQGDSVVRHSKLSKA